MVFFFAISESAPFCHMKKLSPEGDYESREVFRLIQRILETLVFFRRQRRAAAGD